MFLSFLKNKTENSPEWVNRIVKSKKEYPLFDAVVLVFVAFLLIFQILIQISPFVSLLALTPLSSMMTYLGVLGGVLVAVDLFTTKKVWMGKYCYLLYAIVFLACLASLRMMNYGVKENIYKISHALIQFALVYSCVYRLNRETLKKSIKIVLNIILIIWLLGCLVSIFQFANQIKYRYIVNPLGMDSSSTRQGFYDNRLFGIFYTLNHAAYVSLILFTATFFRLLKTKKTFKRVLLIIAEVILLCHMILTNSRSAMVSFGICSFVAAWIFLRNKFEQDVTLKKKILVSALSVVIAVCCVFTTKGIKYALTYVPSANAAVVNYLNAKNFTVFGLSISDIINGDYLLSGNIDYNEDVLTRENLDEDPSNGRLQLWGDYLSLYKDVGLVGISPGNYMAYVCEHHDDLYIVQQTKLEYPDKFESNIIIHVHNGYIMVFVASGILGVLCLIAFIALCAKDALYAVFNNKKLSKMFVCAFLLVIACAISAMFDEGIFFQSSPQTTVFWLSLGFIMKECQ